MFELTPKHFVDLVEKLYQDKKIPFGKGSLLSQNQLDEFYFHLTIFFVDDEPICEENVCKGLFKRDPLFSINVYYKYYVEAFGKEPFNLAQELHDAISQNRPIVIRSNMPESFDQGYINNQNIYYSGIEDLMNMAEISPEGLPIEDSCGFSGSYGYGDAETGDADGRLVSVSMYRNKQGYYEVTVDHTW